jgi:hypothetical protein
MAKGRPKAELILSDEEYDVLERWSVQFAIAVPTAGCSSAAASGDILADTLECVVRRDITAGFAQGER